MEDSRNISGQENPENRFGVEALYTIIENAPLLTPVTESKAPFADYADNTSVQWSYVEREAVEKYLKERLFFDTAHIAPDTMKEIAQVSAESPSEPLRIPLRLVVCAFGFDTWLGRPLTEEKSWNIKTDDVTLSGKMKSIDVMKLYAGTPSEVPGVGFMNMYIQPDTKVFFDNDSGDSHRIAAAILRGYEFLEAHHVRVYQLSENYL